MEMHFCNGIVVELCLFPSLTCKSSAEVERTRQLFNAAMHEVKAVDSVKPSLLPSMAKRKFYILL